jgi:chromosome segregation ATPase
VRAGGGARTALQSAERGVALAGELERVVEARVAESRDAFKACEQDEACRVTSRLRELEEAFNQAHMQKQRIASARAEATQRHAELEARFKTLEQNAAGASCPKAP